MNKRQTDKPGQQGSVTILVAFMMTIFVGLMAVAVDIGYFYLVKNRLQNAADAAALDGVATVYRAISLDRFPAGTGATFLSDATTAVNATLQKNDISTTLTCQTSASGSNYCQENWWQSIKSTARFNNPAVVVKLTQTAPSFFAKIFGISGVDITASATAIVPYPISLNSTLPMVVSDCTLIGGWDFVNNKPKTDGFGNPYAFLLSSDDPAPGTSKLGCTGNTGSWTNLLSSSGGGTALIQSYIPTSSGPGVTVPITYNMPTYYMNGVAASTYQAVKDCAVTGNSCRKSIFPIVYTGDTSSIQPSCISGSGCLDSAGGLIVTPGPGFVTATGTSPVKSYACIEITDVSSKSNNKYVKGTFASGCHLWGSPGGTVYSGVLLTPRLAQ